MSDKIWTPHDISVLLHHYGSLDVWPRGETRAYVASIQKLVGLGLLKDTKEGFRMRYQRTERGGVLVNALCSTPVPVAAQKYVEPRLEPEEAQS